MTGDPHDVRTARELLARFVHDGDDLTDEELARLVELVTGDENLLADLREQLVVHELLAQQLVESRGDFAAQIAQRIRDERSGMVGGLSSIDDLRVSDLERLVERKRATADEATDPSATDEDADAASEDNGLDLREHALRNLDRWQRDEHRGRRRLFFAGLAALLLVAVGLVVWSGLVRADYGTLHPQGGVTLTRDDDERTSDPNSSIRLQAGDRIATAADGAAEIRYRDGTTLAVGGGTTLSVAEPGTGLGKVVTLRDGDVTASVAPQPRDRMMMIGTPDALVRVLGTEFSLHVRDGLTRLDVSEGRVALLRLFDERSVTVAAGQFTVATRGVPLRTAEAEFPTATWERADPTTVGLRAEPLATLGELVGGNGCVVRQGKLVHEWGDPTRRGSGSRVTDPVLAHLVFVAVAEGKLTGLDEPVLGQSPRLADVPGGREITWEQLVTHTSGYGTTDAPGAAFRLDPAATALLADTLLDLHVADWPRVDRLLLLPVLTGPLQCEDHPTLAGDPQGLLRISPRDLARFGLLSLHEGRWRDRRLLDRRYAARAISEPLPRTFPVSSGEPGPTIDGQRRLGDVGVPDHYGSHSFGWWVNGVDRHGQRLWPSAPADTVAALATNGTEALFVIPSLDVVVAYNTANPVDWHPGQDNPHDTILARIVTAAE